jgi:S-DNA-T family DNA segregation ATPase FtsK/SpoIIIE
MPHCLIAGATGSGKSVCVNTIVMSILLNARPDEIKLLMVDPKKVELSQYSKLPHMIAPVITEPHGAYSALQWLVKEMQVRYEILKQLGLRNISAFNTRKPNPELEASLHMPIPEQMPLIVAIIDEFADLMMASSADLETPIARIAQMARAVGIHLILATQRPSREVITGIIKANIPTRISFKVASRVNSQIILDEVGAESLLGNGDLLFLPPGSSQLVRAQGAYISDEEINRIVQFLCKQSPPNYLIPSFDSFRALDLNTDDESPKGKDPLYDQALSTVLGSKSASTTFLQRKLKIGYARAASLMDELEANGIIGPQEGAKPRRVLAAGPGQPPIDEEEESDEEIS